MIKEPNNDFETNKVTCGSCAHFTFDPHNNTAIGKCALGIISTWENLRDMPLYKDVPRSCNSYKKLPDKNNKQLAVEQLIRTYAESFGENEENIQTYIKEQLESFSLDELHQCFTQLNEERKSQDIPPSPARPQRPPDPNLMKQLDEVLYQFYVTENPNPFTTEELADRKQAVLSNFGYNLHKAIAEYEQILNERNAEN